MTIRFQRPSFQRNGADAAKYLWLRVILLALVFWKLYDDRVNVHGVYRSIFVEETKSVASNSSNTNEEWSGTQENFARQIRIQQCRLDLEHMLNGKKEHEGGAHPDGLVHQWFRGNYPLLEQIWLFNETKSDGSYEAYYKVMFQVRHLQSMGMPRLNAMIQADWYWEDQSGRKHPATNLWRTGPKNIKMHEQFFLRLEVPADTSSTNTTMRRSSIGEETTPIPVAILPIVIDPSTGENTPRYNVTKWLECDQLERESKPPPHVKIGACMRFRGSHYEIREWMAYHRLAGIQYFWVLLNEEFNIHDFPVEPDVAYIPYNYGWDNYRNYANYTFYHVPFNGKDWSQVAAYNHCLNKAKQYNFDWLITTDSDEFIWIADPEAQNTTAPIQTFLSKRMHQTQVGCFEMFSSPMGRNVYLEPQNKTFELVLDYTYRKVGFNDRSRPKCFYRVNGGKVEEVAIHDKRNPKPSKENTRPLDMSTEARIYHLRTPHEGIFSSGKNQSELVQDTVMRDKYRDLVAEKLQSEVSWAHYFKEQTGKRT